MPKLIRSPEIEDEIIERLARGQTLSVICRDDHMPDRVTVYRWAEQDEAFAQRIARSREIGEDTILDDTLEIADDLEEDPQSRKVRIWARHEALKRWNPRKWGDKREIDVSSSGGLNLVIHESG